MLSFLQKIKYVNLYKANNTLKYAKCLNTY